MSEQGKTGRAGCGQTLVIVAMLLWLALVPAGVTFLTDRALGRAAPSGMAAAGAIALTGFALLLPFVGVTLLTRRRPEWHATAAAAAGLAAAASYITLDSAVRTALPESPNLAAAVRLSVLVPCALLAARLTPRLAGAGHRPLEAWVGLSRFDRRALLLALAAAALVTLPWPVTGALGDSLASLGLAFQTMAWVIPLILIYWGVIFLLLTSTFARTWVAALVTILIYGLSALGAVLPTADWNPLQNGLLLLPAALLLTELRARETGVYPLLPLAFCYRVAPLLFVDPRDAMAQGIPELQHIASHAFVAVTATALGIGLWIRRRFLSARRGRVKATARSRLPAVTLALVLTWGTWAGLYFFAGEPGFANDGFLIILEEQGDLNPARRMADRKARLAYVYETLVEKAERTQAPLRAQLDKMGVPYRPYYIINMIRVDGHRWLMRRFEGQPVVAKVILNPNVRKYPHRISIPYGGNGELTEEIQSNLAAIHADEAWALGVTGEGIVVGGQDTGYDWTHPALKSHYRGWDGQNANHNYNWHDAWDDAPIPFDDGSHGTHTMGTVLGDDDRGNRTGVAPGAQWIGCRNMRRGLGNPAAYAECTEFLLAPYPRGGDPFTDGDVSRAPHVVSNSWGCPDFEGCLPGTLEPAVEALRAAGIMMVVSAGNDGPACGTATTPPANYDATFTVGATEDDGDIVGFSSRGPAGDLVKPDVVAPGAYVRSSVAGGGYGYAGGTSMAAPHVAGAVALLWSAKPALIGDVDATERLICQAAVARPVENACTVEDEVPKGPFAALLYNPVCACGGARRTPNNVYGCGLIDAGAAVRDALGQ